MSIPNFEEKTAKYPKGREEDEGKMTGDQSSGDSRSVLMKNGNHITLSSVSPHRGLCTYWTSTEEIKEQNKLDEEETPKFFSVEINEPYEDEPWYHFIMDLNRPECNLHAVISNDSIIK